MEDFIRFTIRHRISMSIAVVVVLLLAWLISFFLSNSLILVKIDSSELELDSKVAINIDGKLIKDIEPGKRTLITIPRESYYISAQSSEYSTLKKIDVPLIVSEVDIELKPHQATSLADTSGNNCYYERGRVITSWQCNELEFDVRTTTYSDNSFPVQSSIDISDEYFEYAKSYKNGFLAISNIDGVDVHYADFSQSEPNFTRLGISQLRGDYSYETAQLVIDTQNSNNFVVLDRASLKYRYYQDSLTVPAKSGTLPDDFKLQENTSNSFSLEGGELTYYSGQSSDDLDNHATDLSNKDHQPGRVVSYSILDSKITQQQQMAKLLCNQAVIADNNLACIDRGLVKFYKLDNLNQPTLMLDNAQTIFSYDNSIYVSQDDSIYQYNTSKQALHSIFKISDRNIASSYIRDGILHVSAWYTYPDERQRTIAYQVDLSKTGVNPPIVNNFPFGISIDMAYGVDTHDQSIYIRLVDNTEENRSKVRSKLESTDVLKKYDIVFDNEVEEF